MKAQTIINQSKPEKFTKKDWKTLYYKLDKEIEKEMKHDKRKPKN
jgi:hypothetical protein